MINPMPVPASALNRFFGIFSTLLFLAVQGLPGGCSEPTETDKQGAPHSVTLTGGVTTIWTLAEMGFTVSPGKVARVVDVVKDSPAYKAGLRKGDFVLSVDQNAANTKLEIDRNGKHLTAALDYGSADLKAEIPKLAPKPPLEGKINRLDLLAEEAKPVSPLLRPGIQFNETNLPACRCGGAWFILPDWAPGIWASAEPYEVTDLWKYNFKTKKRIDEPTVIKARFLEPKTIGLIKDKLGRTWHHPCVPYLFREDVEEKHFVSEMLKAEPVEVTDKQFGFHWKWLSLQLDKDQVITHTWQYESVAIFTKADGLLENGDQVIRCFDMDGHPFEEYQRIYKKVRIEEFEPVPRWFGYDVQEMFKEYLERSGQEDLMPTSAPAQ